MFNNDKINNNKDAAIIEGPDAVLNSSEENNPNRYYPIYNTP